MTRLFPLDVAPGPAKLAEIADAIARPTGAPFGAYVFGPEDPGAELGRAVEREVFLEAFGNTPDQLAEEYGPYERSSLFLVVVDHRRRAPAGAVRMILPDRDGPGLKSLRDLAPTWCDNPRAMLAGQPPGLLGDGCLDWATLAVSPAYRTAGGLGLVSLGLYQTVMTTSGALGGRFLAAILDRAVYVMSRLRYAQPFVPYGPTKPYLGSSGSLPVYLDLADWRDRLRVLDPDLDAVLFERRGIEPAVDPVTPEMARGAAGLAVPPLRVG